VVICVCRVKAGQAQRWPLIGCRSGAGVDSVVVPLPASLDFKTSLEVGDLLQPDGLVPIPGAGPSRGAHLLAA
jgi:hypothetical protein